MRACFFLAALAFWAQPLIPTAKADSLMDLAEAGNPYAQNTLGSFIAIGAGYNRDCSQAAQWFSRAAAQGNVAAQKNLQGVVRCGRGHFSPDFGDKPVPAPASAAEEPRENAREKALREQAPLPASPSAVTPQTIVTQPPGAGSDASGLFGGFRHNNALRGPAIPPWAGETNYSKAKLMARAHREGDRSLMAELKVAFWGLAEDSEGDIRQLLKEFDPQAYGAYLRLNTSTARVANQTVTSPDLALGKDLEEPLKVMTLTHKSEPGAPVAQNDLLTINPAAVAATAASLVTPARPAWVPPSRKSSSIAALPSAALPLSAVMITGFLIALLFYGLYRFAFFKSWQGSLLRFKIKSEAALSPTKAYADYRSFRSMGGKPESFTGAELYSILVRGGHSTELFSDPLLSSAQMLEIAGLYSQNGKHAEALRLLDPTHPAASASFRPQDYETVIGIYERAGGLGDFVNKLCAGHPDPYILACALAFKRMKKLDEALRVLKMKKVMTADDFQLIAELMAALGKPDQMLEIARGRPRAEWSDADYVTFFGLFVKGGHCESAREIHERVRQIRPLKIDPQLHYDFAVLCERSGFEWLATDLYRMFITEDVIYLDVIERFKMLKEGDRKMPSGSKTPLVVRAGAGIIGGKYEVHGQIGEGGMGIVFAGYDRKLSRKVAIKKMRPEIRSNPGEHERFVQEARIISRLTHPHIVSVHEIVEEEQDTFLIFDYVDGQSLSALILERKRLTLKECVGIFGHVCPAVHFAHDCRVLHRDLKPSNIMIDKNGYAKVMDFGLAREAKDSISKLTHADAAGTPAYMAPEQHMGRPGRGSDIYALGVCLYEMLTGEIPFKGPDFLSQKERMKYAPPNFLAPGLPHEIELLMASALNPDPKKRIGEAAEFLQALKSV